MRGRVEERGRGGIRRGGQEERNYEDWKRRGEVEKRIGGEEQRKMERSGGEEGKKRSGEVAR